MKVNSYSCLIIFSILCLIFSCGKKEEVGDESNDSSSTSTTSQCSSETWSGTV